MAIYISGTTGISGVDGSAGTPAVQGTDTNTGVFYPAADTVGVSTGGSERMRVDSSGNVGIGTSSPSYALDIRSGSLSGALGVNLTSGTTLTTAQGSTTNVDMAFVTKGAGLYTWTQGSTERMRIDSSGNVGIGTSSPASLLDVTGNDPTIRLTDNAGSPTATWSMRSTDAKYVIRDVTNSLDRMTIDSSGNLLFNSGYGSAATAYGCRAWVNFNGTGTVAIRASGNVSSITDNGVGNYTVNFTNAMPDTNYATIGTGYTASSGLPAFTDAKRAVTAFSNTSSSCRIQLYRTDVNSFDSDSIELSVAVFR